MKKVLTIKNILVIVIPLNTDSVIETERMIINIAGNIEIYGYFLYSDALKYFILLIT